MTSKNNVLANNKNFKQVYLSTKYPYQSRMHLTTTLEGIIDVGGDLTWKQLARK